MENRKITGIVLVLAIFIGAGAAGHYIFGYKIPQISFSTNKSRASSDPVLSLQSSNNNPALDQEFTVSIKMDAGNRKVSAAELHVTSSPNLEIVSVTTDSGSFLPVSLPGSGKTANQATIIVGSEPDSPETGNGTLAVLNMKALSGGDAQIKFGSDTKVAALYSAGNVLAGSSPLGIFIGNQPVPPPSSSTLTIQSESLPDGWVNGDYAVSFVVSGGPSEDYTWSSEGSLPSGFSITSKGILNGVPSVAGNYDLKVLVKSGSEQVTKIVKLIVKIFTGGNTPPSVIGVAMPPGNTCSQTGCHFSNPNTGSGGGGLEWSNNGKICRSKTAGDCPNTHITDDQQEECTRTAGPTADWSYPNNPWYSLYYDCRAGPTIEWRNNYLTCFSPQTGVCPGANPKGCRAFGTEAEASEGGYVRLYNPNNPPNCNDDVGPVNPNLAWSADKLTCSASIETACPAKNPDRCSSLSNGSSKGADGRWYRYYKACTDKIEWSPNNLTCTSGLKTACPDKNPDSCNATGISAQGADGLRWYRYYQNCTGASGGPGGSGCDNNPSDPSCSGGQPPEPPPVTECDANQKCFSFCTSNGLGRGDCTGWCKENGGYDWCSIETSPGPNSAASSSKPTITIRAMGTFAGGAYPRMVLKMGNDTLGDWDVTGDWADYTITLTAKPTDNLRVYFVNDYFKKSTMADRNLFVDYIAVGRNTYRSDSTSTYASGRYISGNGCSAGFLGTNELDCDDSYFEYPLTKPAGISLDSMFGSWTANLLDVIF